MPDCLLDASEIGIYRMPKGNSECLPLLGNANLSVQQRAHNVPGLLLMNV